MTEKRTPQFELGPCIDAVKESLRRNIPRKPVCLNGVSVRTYKWTVPFSDPDFEAPIPTLLKERVCPGDSVTIIGGGHGVCTTHAARAGASVTVYEPSRVMFNILNETVRRNRVSESVRTRHALVGAAYDVWGAYESADRCAPSEIEPCDLLVLDCEGAEDGILDGLAVRPRTILVEVHENQGVDLQSIIQRLRGLGYTIETTWPTPNAIPIVIAEHD